MLLRLNVKKDFNQRRNGIFIHQSSNNLAIQNPMNREKIQAFIDYVKTLKGDEKGEAQNYCERLFQTFDHKGLSESGIVLEKRVKDKKNTKFADLVWEKRVLIEMKKRGEKLESHKAQIFSYWWNLQPNRPKYSILCNFDEFVIYDFAVQEAPLDKIKVDDLLQRASALNFLYPRERKPVFDNNTEEVTRDTAIEVAKVFNSLIERNQDRKEAQKFILQCIFAMFAEDFDLLPDSSFVSLVRECLHEQQSSYDLLGGLFLQMANPKPAKGGRYQDIKYFNGGLFDEIIPIELNKAELLALSSAAKKDWRKVNPTIFGTIFQSSMDKEERHAQGAHFTSELDILKVVYPTIIQPWQEKIEKAKKLPALIKLLEEIRSFKVLDPACGSGNFLYIAFTKLKDLELQLLSKIHTEFPSAGNKVSTCSLVSVKQFYGIDLNEFATELAKVTLLLAKEIGVKESNNWFMDNQIGIDFELEAALPLDNLDNNIIHGDSLFLDWEKTDVIIGNPPFLGGRNLRQERGNDYTEKIYAQFPDAKGQPDFCVFWFQKAHLHSAKRVGLVGTNSISQGVSREASLNFIAKNGGIITNAISTQVWSGEANVHVSIVNWVKSKEDIPLKIRLDEVEVAEINTSLKAEIDVTKARKLNTNLKQSFQSCELAGKGFVISEEQAKEWIIINPKNQEVLKQMIDGSTLVNPNAKLEWVIDFNDMRIEQAMKYKEPFNWVKKRVKPVRDNNVRKTRRINWWRFGETRPGMRSALKGLKCYFCLPKVAKYTCFQAIDISILPCEANMVVASDDFFILGILNSKVHLDWVEAQKSTLEDRTRYTNTTCYETFPFPTSAKEKEKGKIREIMTELENYRKQGAIDANITITDFYNLYINEPSSELFKLHQKLNQSVCSAYGWKYEEQKNYNEELLKLNKERFELE